MWRLFVILPLLLSAIMAIRVPVVNTDKDSSDTAKENTKAGTESKPTYYHSDEAAVDSYLVPTDHLQPAEQLPVDVIAPATYLVPPAANQPSEYHMPLTADIQTDWYPIQNKPAKLTVDRESQNTENGHYNPSEELYIAFKTPSRQLEPPYEDSSDNVEVDQESQEIEIPALEKKHSSKISTPPGDLQLPSEKVNRDFNTKRDVPMHLQLLPPEPTLTLHLTPPKPVPVDKYPTKLYPKKYNKFRPVPIPVAQYADPNIGIPKAKPLKHIKPIASTEDDYYPLDEKKIYQLEKGNKKKESKERELLRQQQIDAAAAQAYAEAPEQETSESNFRHPGRNSYPAPLRQAPPRAPQPQADAQGPPPPGERTEFRMHGIKGPHSYQFGYDTGKGKNRQFRFEERDNEGRVRGHYGYMDKSGKMRVVNYNADPESGFHAEAPQDEKL